MVLLFSIDTLRADHLGCYGYPRPTSPAIDDFARDAVLFKQAISQSYYTAPAHMSIFTGLTPAVHQVKSITTERIDPLDPGIETLASVLRRNGYSTIGYHGGGQVSKQLGFDRGFDGYFFAGDLWKLLHHNPDILDPLRARIRRSRRSARPLFLFLHHYICHDPYLKAPRELRTRFLTDAVEGLPTNPRQLRPCQSNATRTPLDFETKRSNFWKNVRLEDPRHRRHIVSLYDGGVLYSDYIFEEVLKLLKRERVYDRSLIVLLSDHGEEFYEHGGNLHEKLFVENLHVPLIVRLPSGRHRGRVIDLPVRTMDLMPTLLDVLGLTVHQPVQGVSLLPLMRSAQAPYNPSIASYSDDLRHLRFISDGHVFSSQPSRLEGEMVRQWLFDRKRDPREQRNLADKMPETVARLRSMEEQIRQRDRAFLSGLKERGPGAPPMRRPIMDDQLRRQLRSLGYIQ